MRRGFLKYSLAVVLFLLVGCPVVSAQPKLDFGLGFKELSSQIPSIAGEPLEIEMHDPATGDSLQPTTTGLMVWRKADNWTAFTNGHRSWVKGPYGLQERSNEDRFRWELGERLPGLATREGPGPLGAGLTRNLLIGWYGNPHAPGLGILGQYSGDELARRLREQAEAYAPFTEKKILPAYNLIAVVAQGGPGADAKWRRREFPEMIESMLQQARANGFALILDVQVGHSTVREELEYLRPYLEQPEVYLALDPEFDMEPGETPGIHMGRTWAADVNYAIQFLDGLVHARGLPPKVLIVHEFTSYMLPDKEKIGDSSVVDVVLSMDGYGTQAFKRDSYRRVMERPLEYPGFKLFHGYDPGMLTPEEVMRLTPVPAVISYQ